MLETIRGFLGNGIYRGWEKAKNPIVNKFGYSFPLEYLNLGDRGYVCDEKRRSVCKVFCCSEELPTRMNPLEIAILSKKLSIPPSDFIETTESATHIYNADFIAGKTMVSTPFKLKIKENYCLFSEMPYLEGCEVYETRPLQCRMYPIVLVDLNQKLVQRKSCPGFKKGEIITKPRMKEMMEMGKISTLMDETLFDAEMDDVIKKRHERIGGSILERMDIDSSQVQDFGKRDLHGYVEALKSVSDLEEEMERQNMGTRWLEKKLAEFYSLESLDYEPVQNGPSIPSNLHSPYNPKTWNI